MDRGPLRRGRLWLRDKSCFFAFCCGGINVAGHPSYLGVPRKSADGTCALCYLLAAVGSSRGLS